MIKRTTLVAADIARALTRKHKKCKTHGDAQIVCLACARVHCPICSATCPRCGTASHDGQHREPQKMRVVMVRQKQYAPPPLPTEPRLRDVQLALQPFQVLGIERHTDSGEWMAIFPFKLHGYHNAAELAEQVLKQIKEHAVGTPYGSGRLFKPDRWFVSFKLRERREETSHAEPPG